ncbi:MAG: undecaprenyl-diphosphate phosphatase [Bradymonadaceae bacterium]
MSVLDAILLGILQGATEFLPISSSGHLELAEYLLGISQPGRLFDIVLHVGTLAAIVTYYRDDVLLVGRDTAQGLADTWSHGANERALDRQGVRLAVLTIVASIPTAFIGAGFDRWIDIGQGADAALFVCVALVVNGFVLTSARWLDVESTATRSGRTTLWNITPSTAALIGVAQGLAVTPGLSRSGLTIVAALALGTIRDRAARFSFLISIPAILGALALEFDPDILAGGNSGTVLAVGALTATLVGYLALAVLVRLVERAQFHHFSWYCWAIGGGGAAYLLV